MRVHLRSDRGAVAVITAILALALIGIAAFTTDFGLAYVSKRDLQKASDAAALAAASEIIKQTAPNQNCSAIATRFVDDAIFRQAVISAADSYAQENRPSATRESIDVRCSADNRRVEVSYAASGQTDGILGGVFGAGPYVAQREATAQLFVRSQGLGLRPYFICDGDLAGLRQTLPGGGKVFEQVEYPSDNADCSFYTGNWYTSDCPDDGNNGTLGDNTLNGCLSEVGVVIDQDSPPPPTQAQIEAAIISACTNLTTDSPARCLESNPGNIAAEPVITAWQALLTLPGFAVPTFNQSWNTFADAQVADCRNGGNNGCYPIEGLAAVKACAYKWGNNKTGIDVSTAVVGGVCEGASASMFPDDNNNYLYLKLINLQFSGSSKPSSCPLGDPDCDQGGRGTNLIK